MPDTDVESGSRVTGLLNLVLSLGFSGLAWFLQLGYLSLQNPRL